MLLLSFPFIKLYIDHKDEEEQEEDEGEVEEEDDSDDDDAGYFEAIARPMHSNA